MTFDKIIARYNRWKSIHETINELNRLDNRELNDLGISRWRISEIAHRTSA
jgi:uncharacterized protein YjiS (DUF1127 family)